MSKSSIPATGEATHALPTTRNLGEEIYDAGALIGIAAGLTRAITEDVQNTYQRDLLSDLTRLLDQARVALDRVGECFDLDGNIRKAAQSSAHR